MIRLVAAMDENGLIADESGLPWQGDMPDDVAHFRKLSYGKPMIIGSHFYDELKAPLEGRKHIVLTRDTKKVSAHKDVVFVHSVVEALKSASKSDEVVIAGGAQIYALFLPYVDHMSLTIIHATFKGNVYFPKYTHQDWKIVDSKSFSSDQINKYGYTFLELERKV